MKDRRPARAGGRTSGLLCALTACAALGASCNGCREPNGPCTVTSDCFSSEVCVDQFCRAVCNADLDCTGREACLDGVCLPVFDAGVGDAAALDVGIVDRSGDDRFLDDRPGPDRAAPSDASSDRARTDSFAPDLWQQDHNAPDLIALDLAQPDAWRPDQSAPDANRPDSAVSDGAPPDAGRCWYHQAWLQRWPLTVDNPTLESITDFPVLLRLDCAELDCTLFGPTGAELRVVDQNCRLLPHEVERWSRQGESLVWFRVARLEPGGATVYLYGDASGSTMPAPLPASEVWNNGFQGVYHLGAAVTDSSPLTNDGVDSATAQVAAVAGLGRQFNGSQAIRLLDNQPLLRNTDGATVGLWVNLADASTTAGHNLLAISVGSVNATTTSRLQLGISSVWQATATVRRLDSDPDQPQLISPALTRGAFHHVVVRVRYGVPSLQAFVDGVPTASISLTWSSAGLTSDTPSRNAALGAQDTGIAAYMRGVLDEVRIANLARSDAWIALDHLAQKAPGIVAIGAAEAGP